MTTSFAHFAQGNLIASFYIQPMGAILAFIAAMAVWAGAYIAITGRAAHRITRFMHSGVILWVLMGVGLLAWAWKIFIQVRELDGWA